mmetsp:Transcript_6644/g.15419  ORF Transcript_6644/g.15419 Transcript_6644/m.15419 type:complete len:196 (-) Transcript_6644:84-671(-)
MARRTTAKHFDRLVVALEVRIILDCSALFNGSPNSLRFEFFPMEGWRNCSSMSYRKSCNSSCTLSSCRADSRDSGQRIGTSRRRFDSSRDAWTGGRASSAAASIDARASGLGCMSVDCFGGFGYSDARQSQAAASPSRRPYGAMIPGRHRRPEDRSHADSWSSLLLYSLYCRPACLCWKKVGNQRGLHFTPSQSK